MRPMASDQLQQGERYWRNWHEKYRGSEYYVTPTILASVAGEPDSSDEVEPFEKMVSDLGKDTGCDRNTDVLHVYSDGDLNDF